MSAEFNSKGFSAVSSFFGIDGTNEESTVKDVEPTQRKRSRLGVGAKDKFTSERLDRLESEETRKKILAVGDKRKRYGASDDESDHVNQSEDEDEGGRTSIQTKEKKKSTEVTTLVEEGIAKKPKKKKKKGKKERMAEKKSQESAEGEKKNDEPTQSTAAEKVEQPEFEAKDTEGLLENADNPNSDKAPAGGKRKRRKIRSKQKNIKKDTRLTKDKPDHLRVGSKSYGGRPITKETRQFLNLPESRTTVIKRERSKHKHEISERSDGGLFIDDLLKEPVNDSVSNPKEDMPDSGELVNESAKNKEKKNAKKKKKDKAKKKKTKFKNLK